MAGDGRRFFFGEFVVDRSTFELRRAGELVPLEPKVFDLLVYLVTHRERVIAKEELLDEVWGDRFVSESALTSQVRHVRRALGDDGRHQGYVRTVHGRGYQFVADVRVDSDDPADGGPRVLHNLPTERRPLFGRATAVDVVDGLLDRHRLVSLLGIGGAGKTRLAVAAGRAVLSRFPDGVWFVDLVPADDDRSVDLAIARACGLALEAGRPREQLASLFANREALVVLDSCEHVTESVASTVDLLLERAAGVHVLATSREPLGLDDERRVNVEPLAVAGGRSSPAVALFTATADRLGVDVDDGDVTTIAEICDRVDGLPLAIELAAGQLRLLTPRQVLDRLDDPLRLLQRPATAGDRHASVHDVLWSTWQMLDPGDVALLSRLAAFPGPIDLADAEATAASLDLAAAPALTRLVDRSLVAPIRADLPQVRLVDTVRHFAREQTDARAEAAWHAEWCLGRTGSDPMADLFDFALAAWCARHSDDLRAAEHHLVGCGRYDDAAALTTATSLAVHCDAGSYAAEILQRIEGHLARVDDAQLVARLHCTGVLAAMASRSPVAIATHGRAARAFAADASSPALEAVALVLESWSTVFADPQAALALVERAAALAEDAGAGAVRDHADGYRAIHLAMLRRYDDALDQAEGVIARAPEGAELAHGTFVAMVAASAITALDDPDRASRWVDQLVSLPTAAEPMWANEILASAIHASAGRADHAARLAERVRARSERAGRSWLPDLLVPPAMLAHHVGDDVRAARWLAAVRTAAQPTQSFQVTIAYRRLRERVGTPDGEVDHGSSLDHIGAEALGWLAASST